MIRSEPPHSTAPPDGPGPDAGAPWVALLAKYRVLTSLREAKRRGEGPAAKEVFVQLARVYPGALYELDTLPDAELAARVAAVAAAAAGGEVAPWMRWMVRYHELVATSLATRASRPKVGERASVVALRTIAAEEAVSATTVSLALFRRSRRGLED